MTDNVNFLRISTGSHERKVLIPSCITCNLGDDIFPVPGFNRVQCPIQTCFAITTNKAQGQLCSGSLGFDLHYDFFTHGLHYVAQLQVAHSLNISDF